MPEIKHDIDTRNNIRETQASNRMVVATHGIGAKMAQRSASAFDGVNFARKSTMEEISAVGSPDPLDQVKATIEHKRAGETKYDRNQFILSQYNELAMLSNEAGRGDKEAIKALPFQKLYLELVTRKLLRDEILEPEILKVLVPRAEKLGIDLKTKPEETYVNTSESKRVPMLKKVAGTVAKVLSASRGS